MDLSQSSLQTTMDSSTQQLYIRARVLLTADAKLPNVNRFKYIYQLPIYVIIKAKYRDQFCQNERFRYFRCW